MAESSKRQYYSSVLLILIVAVGAFLLLFHLDHRPFWQDEAETACLAKNVLTYGVPRAYDGLNLISQEQGREFGPNYLWRWSPWLQIYVTAAAFHLGGLTTYAGRLPFAVFGLACIWMVYFLVRHIFNDRAWALWSAAVLTCSVPFLLYSRQCRYYSLGAFFVLLSLYAFREDWQKKFIPACLLCFSVGALFYTNYLLFFTYLFPAFLAAIWLYHRELPLKRVAIIGLFLSLIIVPGLLIFKIQQQSQAVNLALFPVNLEKYFGGLCQFLLPLPIILILAWRWRRIRWTRTAIAEDPEEKFVLFLSLIILGNIIFLALAPQCEHRYLVHLYPLSAIILGWIILKTWRYLKVAGVLLAVLLLVTNWLYLVPLEWLNTIDRPMLNNRHMLTYPNLPLKLFLTELINNYPDPNRDIIRFFHDHARPGDIILTTYCDLPLQFYTPYQVIGGLQGTPAPPRPPDWVISRWETRWDRAYRLNDSERYIKEKLSLATDYQAIPLAREDEAFGNRADPYVHRFIAVEHPLANLIIYKKLRP